MCLKNRFTSDNEPTFPIRLPPDGPRPSALIIVGGVALSGCLLAALGIRGLYRALGRAS